MAKLDPGLRFRKRYLKCTSAEEVFEKAGLAEGRTPDAETPAAGGG
jgi:hypothetical protein